MKPNPIFLFFSFFFLNRRKAAEIICTTAMPIRSVVPSFPSLILYKKKKESVTDNKMVKNYPEQQRQGRGKERTSIDAACEKLQGSLKLEIKAQI